MVNVSCRCLHKTPNYRVPDPQSFSFKNGTRTHLKTWEKILALGDIDSLLLLIYMPLMIQMKDKLRSCWDALKVIWWCYNLCSSFFKFFLIIWSFQSKVWTMELKAESYETFFSILSCPLSFILKAKSSTGTKPSFLGLFTTHMHVIWKRNTCTWASLISSLSRIIEKSGVKRP